MPNPSRKPAGRRTKPSLNASDQPNLNPSDNISPGSDTDRNSMGLVNFLGFTSFDTGQKPNPTRSGGVRPITRICDDSLTIRLPSDIRPQLKALARANKTNVKDLICDVLLDFLEEQKQKAPQKTPSSFKAKRTTSKT